ncbi:hypothetical protein NDU88_004433 [Pleurodeles waltl]|uniref:Uncharacterized protein n=1 Tax=Pleurodeles waltl TaxID=8319 RepID=A0AAV7M6B9_PLEWA|nr:hypothetical protein NDU88_004433 [Pleurodeles waltl]
MLHNLALRRHVPFLQEEEEVGDGRVAAVDPVDSEDEEAEDEDEDNRTAVIRQYFQWHTEMVIEVIRRRGASARGWRDDEGKSRVFFQSICSTGALSMGT